MMAAVSGFFENFSAFVTMPKLLLKANGVWKRVQNYSRVVYEVAEEKIHEAIKKDEVDGSLKGSILGIFIHNLKLKHACNEIFLLQNQNRRCIIVSYRFWGNIYEQH